jgi:exonuclease VII small subunit
VSLVFRGSATDRSEILQTLRDLIHKIDSGEVNLEEHGRFLKAGTAREKEAPANAVED